MIHAVNESEREWSTRWEAAASYDQDDDGSYPFDESEYEEEGDDGLWDSEMQLLADRTVSAEP